MRRFALTAGLMALAACGKQASNAPSTNPPASPAGLQASGAALSVTLTWTASPSATGYAVLRAQSSGSFASIGATASTSYTDSGLQAGTVYSYEVQATNANGSSAPTARVSAITLPSAPANLSAQAGDGQVKLAWPGVSGASGYEVDVSTTAGGPYGSGTPAGARTTLIVNNLTNGTKYYFVVRARDAAGFGPASSQASATPAPVPAAPTLSGTGGAGETQLTWSAVANATGYVLSRSTTQGTGYVSVYTGSATSYTDTGVTNGVTDYYVVQATDAAGSSFDSNEVALTPLPALVAPLVTAVGGNNQITLSWAQVPGAASYQIARATAPGGESFGSGARSTSSPQLVDTSNVPNETGPYYYEVRAINANQTGPVSAEVSATPARELCIASDPPYTFAVDADRNGEQDVRRTFGASTMLFNPDGVAVDEVDGEVFVSNGASASITVYPLGVRGDVPPSRMLAGAATLLYQPEGLIVDAADNQLLVFDARTEKILVYPRTWSASGTAPTATISVGSLCPNPPQTGSLAFNPGAASGGREFYFSCGGGIYAWALPTSTNAPSRQISNGVSQPVTSLSYDSAHALIYAGTSNASSSSILFLSPTGTNASPPGIGGIGQPVAAVSYAPKTDQVVALTPAPGGDSALFFNRASVTASNTALAPAKTVRIGEDTSIVASALSWAAGAGAFWITKMTRVSPLPYSTVVALDPAASSASGAIGIVTTSYPYGPAIFPSGLAADPASDELWVSSPNSGFYSFVASFKMTDLLHQASPLLQQPPPGATTPLAAQSGLEALALNPANGEFFVSDSISVVQSWPTAGSPTRPITSLGSLPGPTGLAFDSNQLLVALNATYPCPSTTASDSIAIYNRNSNATLSLSGSISGSATRLCAPTMIWAGAPASAPQGEILVANGDNTVLSFARSATGNATPLQQIVPKIPSYESPVQAIADASGTIYVSIAGGAHPTVLVYASSATGNATPLRTITVKGTTGGAYGLAFCN